MTLAGTGGACKLCSATQGFHKLQQPHHLRDHLLAGVCLTSFREYLCEVHAGLPLTAPGHGAQSEAAQCRCATWSRHQLATAVQLQVAQILGQQGSRTWAAWQQGPCTGGGRSGPPPRQPSPPRTRSCSPGRRPQGPQTGQHEAGTHASGTAASRGACWRPGSPALQGVSRREPWRPPGGGTHPISGCSSSPPRHGASIAMGSRHTAAACGDAAGGGQALGFGRPQPGLPPVQRGRSTKHGHTADETAHCSSWSSALQARPMSQVPLMRQLTGHQHMHDCG